MASFVPGVHSQVGRATEFDLKEQRRKCLGEEGAAELEASPKPPEPPPPPKPPGASDEKEERLPKKRIEKPKALPKAFAKAPPPRPSWDVDPVFALESPTGELETTIQKRLRQKLGDPQDLQPSKPVDVSVEKTPKKTIHFSGVGMESPVRRCPAGIPTGAVHIEPVGPNECRPHLGEHQVQHGYVKNRNPAWDFHSDKPRFEAMVRSVPNEGSFLTSTEIEAKEREALKDADPETLNVRQKRLVGLLPEPRAKSAERATKAEPMTLAEPRCPLGKVGRVHVIYNEVSAPAEDLLVQDTRTRNLRYPEWNFHRDEPRKSAAAANTLEPGKYDINWHSVDAKVRNGVPFDRGLTRSVSCATLGYIAPPAILHPEETRSPGGYVPNLAVYKDLVRKRITNVNDFKREMPRFDKGLSRLPYDETDPEVCALTLHHQMIWDARTMDSYVTERRDIAPDFGKYVSRGKASVAGLRNLQKDLAVRGSVGLGGCINEAPKELTVDQREARAADGSHMNGTHSMKPDRGPKFDHYTVHPPAYAHLPNAPTKNCAKLSSRQKPREMDFKRKPDVPGFTMRTKIGGPIAPQKSRTYEALPEWSTATVGERNPADPLHSWEYVVD
eukprot:gnl/TRDRNA2_/TRDRNA2_174585_c4_seq19.p1 gnl/TRDRNA2_/TRDRNA2_174585_c4~~gnl/TRDRNA2_/TRDRNA2_174585_c4_seq19.p1  ORF type:complete len:614 (+),score=84.72 gnl/TRDRNA2_/TRDRNA2_174585_c4_seq19:181-2022(+)